MAPPPIARPSSSHPPHSSTCSFPGGFGVPPFGAVAVKNDDPGQPSSSSSNRILSFGGQPPSTIDFSGGYWTDGIEAAHQQVPPAPERRSRAHWNTQEHVVAERKRREKMQQQFLALSTIVPDLTKTDKISLLGSTIEYVKELEEKVKTLKGRQSARPRMSGPTAFESQCRMSTDGSDTSGSSDSASGAGGFVPTVEARIHGDTILLRICCKDRRGVLVMLISELEEHGLSIVNTSVVPFTNSRLNITIAAEIGERFLTAVELVTKLTTALKGLSP